MLKELAEKTVGEFDKFWETGFIGLEAKWQCASIKMSKHRNLCGTAARYPESWWILQSVPGSSALSPTEPS